MHKRLISVLITLLLASSAEAQMRYMHWIVDDYLTYNLSPDCENLPATQELLIYIRTSEALESVTQIDAFMDFCTDPEPLYTWWRVDQGSSCREDALHISTSLPQLSTVSLEDPWGETQPASSFSFLPEFGGNPVLARITVSLSEVEVNFEGDTTYSLFRIVFTNPAETCEGCDLPACFILNGLSIHHAGGVLYSNMNYQNYASYNWGNYDCPFIVPVQKTTWGRIKALYGASN